MFSEDNFICVYVCLEIIDQKFIKSLSMVVTLDEKEWTSYTGKEYNFSKGFRQISLLIFNEF